MDKLKEANEHPMTGCGSSTIEKTGEPSVSVDGCSECKKIRKDPVTVDSCYECKNLEKLSSQRSSGELCDVQITLNGHTFSAHTSVLVAKSEYFTAMFTCNMLEQKSGSLDLSKSLPVKDINSFRILMDYFYGKKLTVNLDNAEDMALMSDFLLLSDVKLSVEQLIVKVQFKDLDDYLQWAIKSKKYNLMVARKWLHDIMSARFHDYLCNGQGLLKVTENDFISLLEDQAVTQFMNKESLVKCVNAWISYDMSKRNYLQSMLLAFVEDNYGTNACTLDDKREAAPNQSDQRIQESCTLQPLESNVVENGSQSTNSRQNESTSSCILEPLESNVVGNGSQSTNSRQNESTTTPQTSLLPTQCSSDQDVSMKCMDKKVSLSNKEIIHESAGREQRDETGNNLKPKGSSEHLRQSGSTDIIQQMKQIEAIDQDGTADNLIPKEPIDNVKLKQSIEKLEQNSMDTLEQTISTDIKEQHRGTDYSILTDSMEHKHSAEPSEQICLKDDMKISGPTEKKDQTSSKDNIVEKQDDKTDSLIQNESTENVEQTESTDKKEHKLSSDHTSDTTTDGKTDSLAMNQKETNGNMKQNTSDKSEQRSSTSADFNGSSLEQTEHSVSPNSHSGPIVEEVSDDDPNQDVSDPVLVALTGDTRMGTVALAVYDIKHGVWLHRGNLTGFYNEIKGYQITSANLKGNCLHVLICSGVTVCPLKLRKLRIYEVDVWSGKFRLIKDFENTQVLYEQGPSYHITSLTSNVFSPAFAIENNHAYFVSSNKEPVLLECPFDGGVLKKHYFSSKHYSEHAHFEHAYIINDGEGSLKIVYTVKALAGTSRIFSVVFKTETKQFSQLMEPCISTLNRGIFWRQTNGDLRFDIDPTGFLIDTYVSELTKMTHSDSMTCEYGKDLPEYGFIEYGTEDMIETYESMGITVPRPYDRTIRAICCGSLYILENPRKWVTKLWCVTPGADAPEALPPPPLEGLNVVCGGKLTQGLLHKLSICMFEPVFSKRIENCCEQVKNCDIDSDSDQWEDEDSDSYKSEDEDIEFDIDGEFDSWDDEEDEEYYRPYYLPWFDY